MTESYRAGNQEPSQSIAPKGVWKLLEFELSIHGNHSTFDFENSDVVELVVIFVKLREVTTCTFQVTYHNRLRQLEGKTTS